VVMIGDGNQRTVAMSGSVAMSGCQAEIATSQYRVAPRSIISVVMTIPNSPW
jgi:hypothetical protein